MTGRAPHSPAAINSTLMAAGKDAPNRTSPTRVPASGGEPDAVEATEFNAALIRMIAAQGRRVANADVEDLHDFVELHKHLDEAIAFAVKESRRRWGRSWADIGRAVGISAQGAQQRWGGS